MAYRVVAAYVTATTAVTGGGRAAVDMPRGMVLPGDVPEEELRRFLADGAVETVAAAPAAAAEAVDDEVEPVPTGTVDAVLAWVGDDTDRAGRALTAEQAKGDKARKTLVEALTALVDGQA
jgi:hypothetical protein